MKAGAGTQQFICQLGASLDQMLTIVEDEQDSPRLQEVGDGGDSGASGLLAQIQCYEHALQHKVWINKRGKFDKPHAVGKVIAQPGGDLESKARLAGAARASEGGEPAATVGGDELFDGFDFPLTSNETCQRNGQIIFLLAW